MALDNGNKRPTNDLVYPIESKKRKVEFSTDISVRQISNNEPTKDTEFHAAMFKRFILTALDELDQNDQTKLKALSSQVSLPLTHKDRITDSNLNLLLDMLSHNINKIDTAKGTSLMQSLIHLEKWWELPIPTLDRYVTFLKILCSGIPKWWQDVSRNLVVGFTMALSSTTRHHELLAYFLNVIPSSIGFIDSYLVHYFPNKNDSKTKLVNYVSNLLHLTSYCPELQFQVMSLLIEKLISIDVELQNELDELDDDIDDDIEFTGEGEEAGNEGVDVIDAVDRDLDSKQQNTNINESRTNFDDDDGVLGSDSGTDGDEDEDEDEDEDDVYSHEEVEGEEEYNVEVTQNIKELSNKLDAVLSILSNHIVSNMKSENLDLNEGVRLFNTVVTLFKTHMLPTYYTRSIQYIVFHVSQQAVELMDSYLVTLIDISFAINENSEKKVKALQYLGSYIARAKRLTKQQITFVGSYLTSWLNRYIAEREQEVDQPGGMERFKQFYAVFQALCYIFCFRHKYFRNADGDWEFDLDSFFQRVVISKFNPLKYCNDNVMLMFAKIAQQEDVAYCFGIIESNSNERLRGIMGKTHNAHDSADVGTSNGSSTTNWTLAKRQQFIDLQSYFPFDPLFLKNYKQIMKDYYIEWNEASGGYESDESDN